MDIKSLSIKAKEFGLWVNIFNRKLFSNIANSMSDNENILFMIKGHDLKSSYKYPVVISDKGVYVSKYANLYGSLKNWAIPMDSITNTFIGRGIIFDSVIISIDGDALVISRLFKKTAKKIMELINEIRNKPKLRDQDK